MLSHTRLLIKTFLKFKEFTEGRRHEREERWDGGRNQRQKDGKKENRRETKEGKTE